MMGFKYKQEEKDNKLHWKLIQFANPGEQAGSAGRATASRDRDWDMDSDSESDMRKRGEEAVEEEDEKEGQMTDPETGEEDIASGEAGTGNDERHWLPRHPRFTIYLDGMD